MLEARTLVDVARRAGRTQVRWATLAGDGKQHHGRGLARGAPRRRAGSPVARGAELSERARAPGRGAPSTPARAAGGSHRGRGPHPGRGRRRNAGQDRDRPSARTTRPRSRSPAGVRPAPSAGATPPRPLPRALADRQGGHGRGVRGLRSRSRTTGASPSSSCTRRADPTAPVPAPGALRGARAGQALASQRGPGARRGRARGRRVRRHGAPGGTVVRRVVPELPRAGMAGGARGPTSTAARGPCPPRTPRASSTATSSSSNILRGNDGRVCVADFGLAARNEAEVVVPGGASAPASADGVTLAAETMPASAENPGGALRTAAGTVLGTPLYLAPEQHAGSRATTASDQYSFCVALYQGMYGAPPFKRAKSALLREMLAQLLVAKAAGPPSAPPAESPVPRVDSPGARAGPRRRAGRSLPLDGRADRGPQRRSKGTPAGPLSARRRRGGRGRAARGRRGRLGPERRVPRSLRAPRSASSPGCGTRA